jgi:peptidoglycan/xylan/chitin deacetylase (PgdA/CDA1 family)
MSFIKVHTKNYIVMHGYDHHNKEVEERVEVENTTEKIIAVHRIQSITEKFILTTATHGRFIYWEYEDDYKTLVAALNEQGLLIN